MWYLKSAFDTYQTVQSAVQNRLGEVQSAILSPLELMKRFQTGTSSAIPVQKSEQEPEVDALRKRIAELEAQLGKKPRTKTKKKSSTG